MAVFFRKQDSRNYDVINTLLVEYEKFSTTDAIFAAKAGRVCASLRVNRNALGTATADGTPPIWSLLFARKPYSVKGALRAPILQVKRLGGETLSNHQK